MSDRKKTLTPGRPGVDKAFKTIDSHLDLDGDFEDGESGLVLTCLHDVWNEAQGAHRDSIIREELERLRDEVCPRCADGIPVKEDGFHDTPTPAGWVCYAAPIRARLAQLEDPDAK